jgi:DNA (cytosine-5)-methyltransferase 1
MSRELLSFFCGPGGLDEGFSQAGFQTVLAIDNDEECKNTFAVNHPKAKARVYDVRELTLEKLDEFAGCKIQPVGVLGGPPCQSFSVSNVHQKDDDPRHMLPEAYARLLGTLNRRAPISFFVFENVPGLLSKKHRDKYNSFKKLFQDAGFQIKEQLLDAKDFGVPQERRRIFIVGINQNVHPGKEWNPPSPTGNSCTVKDFIFDLPEPIHNDKGLDPDTFPVHPNHWCMVPRSSKFSEANLEEGQAFGRSFRTLSWDRPSWAVAYGHREVHIHPNGKRRLSIYEAMLLQTFPKRYRLTGKISAQMRLVSEAVPPRLAFHIANSIRTSLGI